MAQPVGKLFTIRFISSEKQLYVRDSVRNKYCIKMQSGNVDGLLQSEFIWFNYRHTYKNQDQVE